MDKQYRLIYFDVKGAAALSRIVFKCAGRVYEDVRVTAEEWDSVKSDMPFEALPVLEVDGIRFSQSAAMARYLAREFGLMGKTNMDELRIDEIHETVSEMLTKHMFKLVGETENDTKKLLLSEFIDKNLGSYLEFLKKRLVQNKESDYFIGKSLTLADLVVFWALCMIDEVVEDIDSSLKTKVPKGKEIQDFQKKIANLPKVAEWIKEEPSTFKSSCLYCMLLY